MADSQPGEDPFADAFPEFTMGDDDDYGHDMGGDEAEALGSLPRTAGTSNNTGDAVGLVIDANLGASHFDNGASARTSLKTATNHHARFLRKCAESPQDTEMHRAWVRVGSPIHLDTCDPTQIDFQHLDLFASYLLTVVPAYETASRYLSAIKNHVQRRVLEEHKVTKSIDTKKIRSGLMKVYAEKAREENKDVSQSHHTATSSDLLAIGVLCVLFQTQIPVLHVFFFLVISLVQFAGRISESALVTFNDLHLHSVGEWEGSETGPEKIFLVNLWRTKTSSQDKNVSIFPHRNHFLLDWYFVFAYSLVLRNSSQSKGCLFPSFYEEAKKDAESRRDTEKQPRSKASGMWNRIFIKIMELSDAFDDVIAAILKSRCGIPSVSPNKDLSSHSGKRRAVELADQHPLIKTTWLCFRAGWKMKMVHTIFDYLRASLSNDRQVGRQLSEWSTLDEHGRLGGGRPPILECLNLHPDLPHLHKVFEFSRSLFSTFFETEEIDEAKANLLTASILRWLPAFIDLVTHSTLFDDAEVAAGLPNHPFLIEIVRVAHGVGIPPQDVKSTLLAWSKEVRKDFLLRNFQFAPFSELREAFGDEAQFVVDNRSFINLRIVRGNLQG